MFRATSVSLGFSSLRAYVDRETRDAYATVADLASFFKVQASTVRAQLSGSLLKMPQLFVWLVEEKAFDATGKIQFAASATWEAVAKGRVAPERWAAVEDEIRKAIDEPWSQQKRSRSPSLDLFDDDEEEQQEEVEPGPEPAARDDSSVSASSDSSSSDCDDDSALPRGVLAWVLTEPIIPGQFSRSDYTKAYSLKSYDMPKSLKNELKKLRKWWTADRNAERKAKSVQDVTADKREERLLCFLGFVQSYKCLPSDDLVITIALYLNRRLFDAYLDYLKQVREASDGTLGEAITSAVSACRWLHRKNKLPRMPQIIRRYMDLRNTYQAKAIRARAQNDVDELKDQNKWIDWTDYTALVARLRDDWNVTVQEKPDISTSQTLHDLLLLGLYSCVPARGAEVRLLQYIPEDMIRAQMSPAKPLTFKKYVDKQQINLITCVDGTWKMFVSQYKNYRSRGVDVTELSNFAWWTDLFQMYQKTYRPLLLGKKNKHDYVFMTRQGQCFTASYFSDFLSTLLSRHTGQKVATNILRSSFVTHFYGSEAAQDPAMRESVANVMRHSVDQALRVYDRRSSASKKHKGLELLASKVAPAAIAAPPASAIVVVVYERAPHQVIREDGERLLLGKMARLPTSNVPIYYLPPDAIFQWQPRNECLPMDGQWQDDGEFVVKTQ